MGEPRCTFVRHDGTRCHYGAAWSVHREGTHPAEVFEVCEVHLPMMLDPGEPYRAIQLFPPLGDLPRGTDV